MTTPPLKSKSEEDASVSRSSVPSKIQRRLSGKTPLRRGQRCPTSNGDRFPLTSVMPAAMLLSGACRTTEVPIAIRSHGLVFGDGRGGGQLRMTPAVVAGITILGVMVPHRISSRAGEQFPDREMRCHCTPCQRHWLSGK